MVECSYCGRRFPLLYKVTAEDIQREKPPPIAFEMACAECLNRVRAISNLVPDQSWKDSIKQLSWMVPLIALVLLLSATTVSLVRVQGLGELGVSSQWLGGSGILFGALIVWQRTNRRYSFTHDLRWTLNSRRVCFAFAIVAAGIIVAVTSILLLR